jgi:hypothetical protein
MTGKSIHTLVVRPRPPQDLQIQVRVLSPQGVPRQKTPLWRQVAPHASFDLGPANAMRQFVPPRRIQLFFSLQFLLFSLYFSIFVGGRLLSAARTQRPLNRVLARSLPSISPRESITRREAGPGQQRQPCPSLDSSRSLWPRRVDCHCVAPHHDSTPDCSPEPAHHANW